MFSDGYEKGEPPPVPFVARDASAKLPFVGGIGNSYHAPGEL